MLNSFTCLLLLFSRYYQSLGNMIEIAIILDKSSTQPYDRYLADRAAIFAKEMNDTVTDPPTIRLWSPVSLNRCPHVAFNSINLKTAGISLKPGYILTHKTIWEDFCVIRPNANDNDVILILAGDFFCQADGCARILDSHMRMQTTDLFYYGFYNDIPKDHWNLPASTHAYSIKCSAVKKIRDTIDPCGTALDAQFHDLVSAWRLSWDYIASSEFTKNITAAKDIELNNFGRVSIVAESYDQGMIWRLQEEKPIISPLPSCAGRLTWNESTGCQPKSLCGVDTHLRDIPNFDGYFPTSLLCDANKTEFKKIYDTNHTRECLRSKRLCVLGDSTSEETIHDLIVLLSGIGTNITNVLSHYKYIQKRETPEKLTINDVTIDMKATGNR